MNAIFRMLAIALFTSLCACESPTSLTGDASTPSDVMSDAMANAPSIERMLPAEASGKIGAPVDVRYLVGEKLAGSSTRLDLAFIPRVAATNMKIEFPATKGVTIESGNERAILQKTSAAEVYRRRLAVNASKGASVRAIVSMEVDGGTFFSVFVIPLEAPTSQKTSEVAQP